VVCTDNKENGDVAVVEIPAPPAPEQLVKVKGEATEGTGTSLAGQVQVFSKTSFNF